MNVKSFWIRCTLIVVLISTSLSFAAAPAYAQGWPVSPIEDGMIPECNFGSNCDPQGLGNGTPAVVNPLVVDFSFKHSNQFVTDIDGASSDPEDIVQLVDDAATVWRSIFQDIPSIHLYVGWADFGVPKVLKKFTGTEFLAGSLVGGLQKDCQDNNLDKYALDLGFPVSTELPAAAGDIIGLYISDDRFDDSANYLQKEMSYKEEAEREVTILFNSELLKIKEPGKEPSNIKLFLDTNPFRSSAFEPIEMLGDPDHRLERSFRFSDPYVIDLFTVALHEVGHALGYSRANGKNPAHIGEFDIPDVLSPYIPFSTRKCPSRADIKGISNAGRSGGYGKVSESLCGYIPERSDFERSDFGRFNSERSDFERLDSEKTRPFLEKQAASFDLRKTMIDER